MIFITKRKEIKLGKLIAATKFIAELSIGETDKKTQIENMSKIIENLAQMAFEIGGEEFAMVQVPMLEYNLKKVLEMEGDKQ